MSSSLDSTTKSSIHKTLGTMATPLFMTMAKLYLCAPNETEWRDTGIWGACGVIMDRTPPISRFIRIYDVESPSYDCRFSEEIQSFMQYNAPSPQFHTFEGESSIIGLSFESEKEATDFMGYARKMIAAAASASGAKPTLAASSAGKDTKKKSGGFFGRLFRKSEGPMQIGLPTDVQHKQHIGYDAQSGFDCTDVPAEWSAIFKNAGIKKKHLRDPATAKVIYETLQSEFSRESYQQAPPPLPPSPAPYKAAPPPLPAAAPPAAVPPPQPPAAAAPPPLPATGPSRMSLVPQAVPQQAAPPLPASVPSLPTSPPVAPPMPPASPPPAPAMAAPTPAPAEEKSRASVSGGHLAAIQSGVKLRKVASPTADSALPDLSKLNMDESNSLASVLQKALQVRLTQVASEDDDEEEDDWD